MISLLKVFGLTIDQKVDVEAELLLRLLKEHPAKVLEDYLSQLKSVRARKIAYAVYILGRIEGADNFKLVRDTYDFLLTLAELAKDKEELKDWIKRTTPKREVKKDNSIY